LHSTDLSQGKSHIDWQSARHPHPDDFQNLMRTSLSKQNEIFMKIQSVFQRYSQTVEKRSILQCWRIL